MGYRVVRNYERLSVKRGGKPGAFCVRLAVPGETLIPEIGVRVEASIGEGVARARGGKPGDLPAEATVDVAVWRKRAMVVRSRKAGDRMRPFGMKGTKKVQDIMVDEGVPCGERDRVAVFECGGEIVWIPGYRIADGWAVAREKGRSLRLVVKPL
jgi:tRNA(Ile)-lysidine synthetase-like protein